MNKNSLIKAFEAGKKLGQAFKNRPGPALAFALFYESLNLGPGAAGAFEPKPRLGPPLILY